MDTPEITFSSESLEDAIKRHVLARYKQCGYNAMRTCKSLKIGRTTFYRMLHRYGVDLPREIASKMQGL